MRKERETKGGKGEEEQSCGVLPPALFSSETHSGLCYKEWEIRLLTGLGENRHTVHLDSGESERKQMFGGFFQ